MSRRGGGDGLPIWLSLIVLLVWGFFAARQGIDCDKRQGELVRGLSYTGYVCVAPLPRE